MAERFVFTEARLRVLPTPAAGKRAVYLDAKQPGFQLRMTSNGVKTFSVYRRVRDAAAAERVTIGRFPDLSVEDARSRAAVIVGRLAGADNPAEARRAMRAELTLGDLFERYIADREKAGKRRTADMRAMWELYLGPMPDALRKAHGRQRAKPEVGQDWSKRRLSEITTEQINALHGRIVKAGKATTANRVHELLRAMYGFGVRHGIATSNPAEGVTPAPERERHRFIEGDELPRFEKALKAEPELWRDYFTVLLNLGYRRAAVAAMQWEHITLPGRGARGEWTVPGERAKNGKPIVLPIMGDALKVLQRRHRERDSSGWVFPGGGAAGHMTQPKKAWARVLKNAKLDDLHIHDLRRTFGSWLAMSGVPLLAIGSALGHKDPRSTQVYARLQTEAVADAVAIGQRAMREAAKGRPARRKRV